MDGNSLYVTNAGLTNYLRIHHSTITAESIIDYTGGLVFRNSGTTQTFKIDNATNQGTFNYNLNTTGITNSSTNAIINNGTLIQNGACNLNSSLTTASSVFFNEINQQSGSIPSGNSALAGLSIHWNAMTSGGGRTAFFNYGQIGDGGYDFCRVAAGAGSVATKLVSIDGTGNLTTNGGVTCAGISSSGDISTTSNLSCNQLTCADLYITDKINETLYRKFRGYSDYINTNPLLLFLM